MGKLRVIGGTARGRRLKTVPGDSTRPIMDRVKENLFNIIRGDLKGGSFLDIFAGTGSVGIEALSQGAAYARFFELDRKAYEVAAENLKITQFEDVSDLIRGNAFKLLAQPPDRAYDYVFIAPPQYKRMWQKAIQLLDANINWLVEDGWVIVQIDPKEMEEIEFQNLTEIERRKYGKTLLVFYERNVED